MSLPPEFYRALPQRPTADLLAMLAHAKEYTPEALEAAREELKKRGASTEQMDSAAESIKSVTAIDHRKDQEPLEWPVRILCILLLGPMLILYWNYQKEGYHRKARQTIESALMGFGLYFFFGLLGMVFDRF